MDKYIEVVQRLGLQDEPKLNELLSLFVRGYHVLFSAKTPKLHIVQTDPDDDKFVECAVALKANFIISGDKDLTEIGDYMGIRIVTPKEFLDSLPLKT